MAYRLKEPTVLPEALPELIPSNHVVAQNHQQWDLIPSSGVSERQL